MGRFGVSKVTAVRALAELEAEGFVRREHGRGTFVAEVNLESIQTRGSKRIALLAPDMQNPFNVEVIGSLEKHLREAGMVVELSCTDYQMETERKLFSKLLSRENIAGIVLISSGVTDIRLEGRRPQVPLVVIDHCPEDLLDHCVFIDCDHYKGGYDAAAHLAGFGHKVIGYLDWFVASRARLQGFRKGLEDFGLTLPDHHILALSPSKKLGHDLLHFVHSQQLTALFAVNDMIAMQAMQVLRASGLAIPEDISLMGYDDVVAARYLEVPLSSVEQHEEQIGQKAAECLLAQLNADRSAFRPREILIVPRVVERETTGPPKRH